MARGGARGRGGPGAGAEPGSEAVGPSVSEELAALAAAAAGAAGSPSTASSAPPPGDGPGAARWAWGGGGPGKVSGAGPVPARGPNGRAERRGVAGKFPAPPHPHLLQLSEPDAGGRRRRRAAEADWGPGRAVGSWGRRCASRSVPGAGRR